MKTRRYPSEPCPDIDIDVTPISLGFDLRAQRMPLVLPRAARTVRYDLDGQATTVTGTRHALVACLEAAGYEVLDPGEATAADPEDAEAVELVY